MDSYLFLISLLKLYFISPVLAYSSTALKAPAVIINAALAITSSSVFISLLISEMRFLHSSNLFF